MDSVLSGCKVMQAELEGNTRALIPNRYATDIFALSIFKFNLGLGGARGWENYQREEQSWGEIEGFHSRPPGGRNYTQSRLPGLSGSGQTITAIVHKDVEYTARKFQKS
jgi:hypothetical protein